MEILMDAEMPFYYHFITIHHHGSKMSFYSRNKCSIFFRLTIYGSEKRSKTMFYGSKKFQKNVKFKNNTIYGKGSIFASD